ncbi:MAG TPA: lysophospholipid acyltransferase family protein [Bacteriovoracaceae bacterium]|nr:lysophospholipid acyltransferase family protein [Bacteriovoracaceae bacterium]
MISQSRVLTPNPLALLRGVPRFTVFCLMICLFLLHHFIAGLLFQDEIKRLSYFMKSIQRTCQLGLRLLGIEVETQGSVPKGSGGRLLIANHLSYVDVLVLFSRYPSLFVTSVEMGEVPVLGMIAKFAGCFFVERRKFKRSAEGLDKEIRSMNEKLQAGFDVFLFPEGTSSDGRTVLPFKATFFQTALDCNVPLVPLCVKYSVGVNVIPWYGEMTFPRHLFMLCMSSGLKARVVQLDTVQPYGDRYQLSGLCHGLIKEEYARN